MTERMVQVGDVDVCCETIGDPSDPPLLLIMGLGMQMIAWNDDLCADLAGRGFNVIRFDNRDAGRSSRMQGKPPTLLQMGTRRFAAGQYSLDDMAQDTAGLIDQLGLGPVHAVGASLGGMIAQTLAARHPDSVRSLTSIMSTTGNRFKGQARPDILRHLLTPAPRDRGEYLDHAVKLFGKIGSPDFPTPAEEIRDRAGRSFDRGLNPAGVGRQLGAILKSGDRTKELGRITAPTLVIHGTADKLISPSGGRATAAAIPGARLMTIEGMGHDLPRAVWPRVLPAIADHAHAADEALATA